MKKYLLDIILVILSGLLLQLAHPAMLPLVTAKVGYIINSGLQEFLALLGLVPFLFVARKYYRWKLFGFSLLLMMAYFVPGIWWVNVAMVVYGSVPWYLSVSAAVLLSFIVAVQIAVGVYSGIYIHRKLNVPLVLALPACWTALELVRNYFLTGFPWLNLAYSQYLNIYFIQTAAIWGIYGINFVLIVANVVFFEWSLWALGKLNAFPLWPSLVLLLLLTLSYSYGVYRVNANDEAEAGADHIKVAMVQGNIDQDTKNFSYLSMFNIMKVYNEMTRQIPSEIDLVIWPEAAPPYNIDRRMANLFRLFEPLEDKMPRNMLMGASTYDYDEEGRKFFNSAYMINKQYRVTQIFDKSHLVPFGEYVPFPDILPVEKIVPTVGRFIPGTPGDGMHFEGLRCGVLICYEGLFPEISRHYAAEDVDFLVNLTNDAWFGPSSMPFQHLAQYSFRAIETRKTVVRSTNTGVSAFINSSGQITKHTQLYKRTTLYGRVPLLHERTIYSYIGDAPAFLCLLFWGIALIMARRRIEKKAAA